MLEPAGELASQRGSPVPWLALRGGAPRRRKEGRDRNEVVEGRREGNAFKSCLKKTSIRCRMPSSS